MARVIVRHARVIPQSLAVQNSWYRTMTAGGASSLAVAAAAMTRAWLEGRNGWRPINAISHIVWGERAGRQVRFTLRYTVVGLLLNTVACGFWAWVHQLWLSRMSKPVSGSTHALTGIAVSALAYVTDYHVIPTRFTPGFELSLSRRSFPSLYTALALGLLMPHYLRFFFLRAMRMLSTRLG